MNEDYITHNFEDTQKLGEEFAFRIRSDLVQGPTLQRVIALYGDLGSGKTTFVQGLAKGLGIEKRIISPTFVIIRKYEVSSRAQRGDLKKKIASSSSTPRNDILRFYHIDLYRTENEKDIKGLGLSEMMNDKNAIVVIEWAEKMESLLPEKRINIQFEYLNEEQRRIRIE